MKSLNNKKALSNTLAFLTFWLIWMMMLLIGLYASKIGLKDSLTISSAVTICLIALTLLIKYGLWNQWLVKGKNFQNRHQIKEGQKQKLTLQTYQAKMKQRSIWPVLINLALQSLVLIITLIVL